MSDRERFPSTSSGQAGVNPRYAGFQIAKALTTVEDHPDAETRERAKERIRKWETVLANILTGTLEYGSRTPVRGTPAWATLEVITGGFATGKLLADGPLLEHENRLLEKVPSVNAGEERRVLNAHFLTDAGLAEIQSALRNGCYDLTVPEEGALMVVAWLVANGRAKEARDVLSEISSFFSQLRFYPVPLEQPRLFGPRVHVQDVGTTLDAVRAIKPNRRILAQRESATIWAPFYDGMVALLLETVRNGWPCQVYPTGWSDRAVALLRDYAELRKTHSLSRRLERPGKHYAQLRILLGKCAADPRRLTGREVGRIRLILEQYVQKRGLPDSMTCIENRKRQGSAVSAPTFYEIAQVVVPRLNKYPREMGIDDVSHLTAAVTESEALTTGVVEGTLIPVSIRQKVERCLNETVAVLIERDLITSGETLARVLPQMTSGIRAAGIADPSLRQLYAAIYRAFRQRRSLLLLNLEKQVQIEELPWVAAIEPFRNDSLSDHELARQTLEEVSVLTFNAFPHAILPNKLLQELRALVKGARLDLPLVDEVAADIFMGSFSGKFLESGKRAAALLKGTLYETYYRINFSDVLSIPESKETPKRFWQRGERNTDGFVQLCASRAGVPLGTWDPATNGMIIEQQQILTTQNLAALFVGLGLAEVLRPQLADMAKQCFAWICQRQQLRMPQWHARLVMVKNTAYAWRQMIFYLALTTPAQLEDFLQWAEDHLAKQPTEFQTRFRPAFAGLVLAAKPEEVDAANKVLARPFLGWSKERHWLLTNLAGE